MLRIFIASSLTTIVLNMPAQAYIDPGATSIVLQWIVGGIAAASTVGSLFFHRIKAFFSKLLKSK